MNIEKQTSIIKSYTDEQLFENLKTDFLSMKENIFCAVRTKESVQKLIFLILDEFRSRNIFVSKVISNKWQRINHFNFTYNENLIKVYDKINNKMVFTQIGIY